MQKQDPNAAKNKIEKKIKLKNYYKYFKLFIYHWLCWVFVAVQGLSLVAANGGSSALLCMGLSLQSLLYFQNTGPRLRLQ